MAGCCSTALERMHRERESGFDLTFATSKLPEYNGLFDKNLRHYFENRKVQKHLSRVGMIDHEGHVIDISKSLGKLSIIEQEFKMAEKAEQQRLREEAEMRRRVQLKRHEALQRARNRERLEKMKEDRKIRTEIVRIGRGDVALPAISGGASSMRSSGSFTKE